MKIEIDISAIDSIPLRYYRGWTIEFRIKTEKFDSPMLCLFGFNSVKELENAMDEVLKRKRL